LTVEVPPALVTLTFNEVPVAEIGVTPSPESVFDFTIPGEGVSANPASEIKRTLTIGKKNFIWTPRIVLIARAIRKHRILLSKL
jgi:hypothetical protein